MHMRPSEHAWLTIAGITASIRSQPPLRYYDDSGYSAFLRLDGVRDGDAPAIEIDVTLAPCAASDAPVSFECEDAWTMQTDDQGYRVSFRRIDTRAIHTVLCSDRSTTSVQVYAEQDRDGASPPGGEPMNPVHYPLDQVLFMNHLAFRGGVICHAAAAVMEERAFVFAGVSGAGKTTLSRQLVAGGLDGCLLSDDRVILSHGAAEGDAREGARERIVAWGTPWHGDAEIALNASAPLAGLLFLVQAEVDEIVPIATGGAMRRLMPMVSCPWYDPDRLPPTLDTCARVVENTPCYELRFTKTGDLVELLTDLARR